MKIVFVVVFLILVTIVSFFVVFEDSKEPIHHVKLHTLQEKFLKIDIHDEKLDLDMAIKDIKQARKLYPLDNILKRVDIELEHERANKSYKSTKTPPRTTSQLKCSLISF